jgi:hypothetical protein
MRTGGTLVLLEFKPYKGSLVLGNLPVRIDTWMQILANNRISMEVMQEGAQELRIRALETNAYAISSEAPWL